MNGYEFALALLFFCALMLVPVTILVSNRLRAKRRENEAVASFKAMNDLRTAVRLQKEQMAKDDDTITKVERWGRELS